MAELTALIVGTAGRAVEDGDTQQWQDSAHNARYSRMLAASSTKEPYQAPIVSGQMQFEMTKQWRGINLWLSLPASGLAAISGTVALVSATGRVAAGVGPAATSTVVDRLWNDALAWPALGEPSAADSTESVRGDGAEPRPVAEAGTAR